MKLVLTDLNNYLGLILTSVGMIVAIIEKSKKIPLAPITKLCKWVGNITTEDLRKEIKVVNDKIGQLESRQDMTHFSIKELEKDQDQNEMDRIRYTVLRFESDLRNLKKNEVRTQEEFITIFDMISKYEKLVKKNRVTNNKFAKAKDYISKVYEKTYENIEARAS